MAEVSTNTNILIWHKERERQTKFIVHVVIFSKEKNRTMLDFNYVERTIWKWCLSGYLSKKKCNRREREYLTEICSPWSRRCKYLIWRTVSRFSYLFKSEVKEKEQRSVCLFSPRKMMNTRYKLYTRWEQKKLIFNKSNFACWVE